MDMVEHEPLVTEKNIVELASSVGLEEHEHSGTDDP